MTGLESGTPVTPQANEMLAVLAMRQGTGVAGNTPPMELVLSATTNGGRQAGCLGRWGAPWQAAGEGSIGILAPMMVGCDWRGGDLLPRIECGLSAGTGQERATVSHGDELGGMGMGLFACAHFQVFAGSPDQGFG